MTGWRPRKPSPRSPGDEGNAGRGAPGHSGRGGRRSAQAPPAPGGPAPDAPPPTLRRISGLAPPPAKGYNGAERGGGVRELSALAAGVALRRLYHPDENPKQHIPLEEYTANLKSMVQYLKSVDIPEDRVILITPPPLCEAAWEKECLVQGCKLNRLNLVVGEYASACLRVAQDCGTDVLDLWSLMQKDSQDFPSYLSDGLHLSPKGNEFVFSHLWPLIEKKVSSLPLLLPYWRDVAEAKPELSLLGDGDH
uniref:Isoamyl acetate-hydrolyzing esterase 1 homolog n=1 Tax=Equus asinus TaxID=9793 RepID=A0A9L0ICA5_EQUAS